MALLKFRNKPSYFLFVENSLVYFQSNASLGDMLTSRVIMQRTRLYAISNMLKVIQCNSLKVCKFKTNKEKKMWCDTSRVNVNLVKLIVWVRRFQTNEMVCALVRVISLVWNYRSTIRFLSKARIGGISEWGLRIPEFLLCSFTFRFQKYKCGINHEKGRQWIHLQEIWEKACQINKFDLEVTGGQNNLTQDTTWQVSRLDLSKWSHISCWVISHLLSRNCLRSHWPWQHLLGLHLHTYLHAWVWPKFSGTLNTKKSLFFIFMHEWFLSTIYFSKYKQQVLSIFPFSRLSFGNRQIKSPVCGTSKLQCLTSNGRRFGPRT